MVRRAEPSLFRPLVGLIVCIVLMAANYRPWYGMPPDDPATGLGRVVQIVTWPFEKSWNHWGSLLSD